MTAASKDRDAGRHGQYPVESKLAVAVAAAAVIFQGTLVAVPLSGTNAGYAVPAAASAVKHKVIGVAALPADNTDGSAGALTAEVETGVFEFINSSSTDAIDATMVGQPCYAVDDQTVARTPGTAGTRPYAGRIVGMEGAKVLVQVGGAQPDPFGNVDLPLLAGADLSTTGINRFVKLSAANTVVAQDANGGDSIGVLMNSPANGAVAIVRVAGVAPVIASGSISAGVRVGSDTAGRTAAVTSARVDTSDAGAANDALRGGFCQGVALTAGASDTIHQVLLQPMGAIPQTVV